MPTRQTLIVCLLLSLAACGRKDAGSVVLTPTSLYNLDSVEAVLARVTPQTSALDKAVATYKAKKQYAQEAVFLKKYLCQNPSPKGFYELGNALLMSKAYDEAAVALGIAEKLQYQPLYNVMYRLAAAYAGGSGMQDQRGFYRDSLIYQYMQVAIQMGYPQPENFKRDPVFASYTPRSAFTEVYEGAISGRQDLMASRWNDFRAGFTALSLPLTMDTNWLKNHVPRESEWINNQFETYITEMRGARFARDAEDGYYYVGKVREDSAYIAVIYVMNPYEDESPADSTAVGTGHPMRAYYLTTYARQGTLLDKIMIAGHDKPETPFRLCILGKGADFVVEEHQLTYGPTDDGNGTDVKKIIGDSLATVQHYRINPQGKIEKANAGQLALR